MILALVLLPVLGAALTLLLRGARPRRTLLVLVALAHAGLVVAVAVRRPGPELGGLLAADALSLLMLGTTSALFLAVSIYAVGYLAREPAAPREDLVDRVSVINEPERVFASCLLLFLASMTLVTVSHHLGVLWVAVEATTLASTPLIYFHRHRRSLEATWKYILICSVGIGLALLGNLFLAVAGSRSGGSVTLLLSDLLAAGPRFDPLWLKAAFVFLLVGYGTKMGLAPMHTWLPDAHSEAPSAVSALLSGALLNCAFVGILRMQQVLGAAGLASFGADLLLFFGLFSMALAAAFVIRQPDYKRLLAYSSVEHMGILSFGVGLGGVAAFGALFHALNHSLCKGLLFLLSGNLLRVFRTKEVARVHGAWRVMPATAGLFLLGFLAISGVPPSGTFFSELSILEGALAAGRPGLAAAFLLLLGVVFAAMASIVLGIVQGEPPAGVARGREPRSSFLPPLLLAAAVVLLGLWLPSPVEEVLAEAARLVGGGR